jgi:hypothetical protein
MPSIQHLRIRATRAFSYVYELTQREKQNLLVEIPVFAWWLDRRRLRVRNGNGAPPRY